jgi:tetratricopeptide (TPR) repeat protein
LIFGKLNFKFDKVSELVKKFMIRFLTGFLICVLINLYGYSQTVKGSFYVTGKVKVDQGVVDGTHLELFRNNVRVQDLVVNRTGTFRVLVEQGQLYRFHFVNSDYYPKTIDFDTHLPPGVCEKGCEFPPYELALQLYKKVVGVPEMAQQAGKISYNAQLDIFDAEVLRQESSLKKLITDALTDAKQKAVLYDKKKVIDKKIKYDQRIKDADADFRSGNLDLAMKTYREAAMFLPNERYPRDKVDQAYHLLLISQMQKSFGNPSEENFLKYLNYGDLKFSEREYTVAKLAYENALAVRPDESSIKTKLARSEDEVKKMKELAWEEINHKQQVYASRTLKYKELNSAADAMLVKENIMEAKDLYSQAATQIDENSYALLMLQKIGDIISNEDLAVRLSRERDEADKKRLADARNNAYLDAVSDADRLLTQRLYRDALENYELALTIKGYELYPKKQISSINDILAKLQLSGEEYNRLLREGEQLMLQNEYLPARESFLKAHNLIIDEKYALQKIEEIDNLLRKLTQDGDLQQKYSTALAEADALFEQQKYPEAITSYQNASNIKPAEKYPKDQLLKIRGMLARDSEEQRRLLQKQTEYDLLIGQADDAFNRQSYQSARSLYQKAILIFPAQEYPKSQIRKIDELLDQLAKTSAVTTTSLDDIDFSNLQSLSKEEREAAYRQAMELGESFLKTKEWGIARFYFRRALSLITNDEAATQKLNEADRMLRGDDVNESKFAEFVKKADESFKTGDISVAKFYYAKALELKPADTYTKERFTIAEQLLRTTMSSAGDREFEDAITKGDQAFDTGNITLARFFYRKALSMKQGNTRAADKLAQCDKALGQEKNNSANSEFDRNIQLGNQAFQQKNYGVAKNYYKQAITFKPNDSYTLEQLSKIESLLKIKP